MKTRSSVVCETAKKKIEIDHDGIVSSDVKGMKYKNSQMIFFHVLSERTVMKSTRKMEANPGKISVL